MTNPTIIPLYGPTGPATLRCFNPRCGHIWAQRGPQPPFRCPRCQSRHWYNPSWPFRTRALPAPITENTVPEEPTP